MKSEADTADKLSKIMNESNLREIVKKHSEVEEACKKMEEKAAERSKILDESFMFLHLT